MYFATDSLKSFGSRLLALLPALLAVTAFAAPPAPETMPQRVNPDLMVVGGPASAAKSAVDTTTVFGGPGTLEGKFQAAGGVPDRQGWIGVDLTYNTDTYWQTSSFHAANLDPAKPLNHAWWCGTVLDSCDIDDTPEGYGNSWNQQLVWTASVADPGAAVAVNVTAVLNHDTEPGYDFLRLQYQKEDGYQTIVSFDGTQDSVVVDETFTVTQANLHGEHGDEVRLRWVFESDGGWSDQDCLWPTEFGAAQIDLITVTFDQGAGIVQMGPTETAEPGDPGNWVPMAEPGVGDFSQVWPELADRDPCQSNFTPMFAFIDDGQVVPGVGPSLCTNLCYVPGGFVVNFTGGRRGPEAHLHNEIWSPTFALPAGENFGAELAFDVFRDNRIFTNAAGIFYTWSVRSTSDPAGVDGWTDWRDDNFVYEGGPNWDRHGELVGDLLLPDARHAQIALGVFELGWVWGIDGTDASPAPYFDNVAFKVWPGGQGPDMRVSTRDLANDGFPSGGVIDVDDLGANSVRFDAAVNIDQSGTAVTPGDSLVIYVNGNLVGPPVMHYRLNPNPLFDPYRTSGAPLDGQVPGQVAYQNGWAFDLPDTAFFFPGDEIQYYFEASQDVEGTITTSTLPADTTGFGAFDGPGEYPAPHYNSQFRVRALPSLRAAHADSVPRILVWDDADVLGEQRYWRQSLAQIGLYQGLHYDLYTTRTAISDESNGLAGRAVLDQISPYTTMLYTSAHLRTSLSGQTYQWGDPNPAPDIDLLDDWLRLGDRGLLLMGDQLVSSMEGTDGSTIAFLNEWVQAQTSGADLMDVLDGQINSEVAASTGNPVFTDLDLWRVYTCGRLTDAPTQIDAVEATGAGQVLATFHDRDGDPGAYPYAAGVLSESPAYTAKVILLPYGLHRFETAFDHAQGPLSARAVMLGEVLEHFGHGSFGSPTPVPSAEAFTVAARPNPFNPRVTIEYALPQAAELSVRIVDVRGRQVRGLHDGRAAAGPGALQWDGVDDRGRASAAGVYFCEVKTRDHVQILKLALIK